MAKSSKLAYNPLDMIMSGDEATAETQITELNPNRIAPNPHQPRRTVDDVAQRELVASIAESGIHEPLIVREVRGGKYQLVAGGRRLAAALELDLRQVPVVVRDYSDEQAEQVALIENLQRANLRFDDEALALLKLQERYGLSSSALGRAIGKSADYVDLRLAAALHPDLMESYIAKQLNTIELMKLIRERRNEDADSVSNGIADDEVEELNSVSNGTAHLRRWQRGLHPRRPHSAFRPLASAITTLNKLDAARLDNEENDLLVEYCIRMVEVCSDIIEKHKMMTDD